MNQIVIHGRCESFMKSENEMILVIAARRNYKESDGNILEDFFDVSVTGNKAEFMEKYFSKDRAVLVVGELQRTKVIANEIEYTDWKIRN